MKPSVKQRLFWIVIAFLIAGVIFCFSSQDSPKSEDLSDSVARALKIEQKEETTKASNQNILLGLSLRKFAHVFLFMLLGFSLYFVYSGISGRVFLAAFTALLYGAADEWHQSYTGRFSRWQDVLIDMGGAVIGILLAVLAVWLLRKAKEVYEKRPD